LVPSFFLSSNVFRLKKEADALRSGCRRFAGRAVKAAWFLRSSGAKRRALTGEADGSGAGFSQEGLKEGVSASLPETKLACSSP
jgi:hypothetical protein